MYVQTSVLRKALGAAAMLSWLGSCSPAPGGGPDSGATPSATGGSSAGSGGKGTGGASVSTGGASATGGVVGSGGAVGSGGSVGSGGVIGGGGSGGVPGGGGSLGSGGSAAGGGNVGTGGSGARGGATGSGGSAGRGSGGSAGAPVGTGGVGGASACVLPPPVATPAAGASDVVDGNLIQFNDNGAWCWFQDERAVVDIANGKLIVGSVANADGVGGAARDGQVEVVIHDLKAKTSQRSQLFKLNPDDHNAPGLMIRPDGKYLAMYSGHNQNCLSYYRTFDGTQWGPQSSFDWAPLGCPSTDRVAVTYANLLNMSAEGKIYSFVRAIGASPNFLVSTNNGQTFTYGGRVTSTPLVGYVAGYYRYWGNGVDRIDFVGTEAHPRDFNTSIYHGYLKGGKSFNSTGKMIDGNIGDGTAPEVTEFSRVFAADTVVKGIKMTRAWMADVQTYDDGSIAVIFKMRANESETDHRFFYARFDGTTWKTTYLSKAGAKLFSTEQDYTGLGALHPNDPHTIYISTTVDPRNDTTTTPKHEIWKGTTCDLGATWNWTPVTQKSTRDNLRPIVPAWDSKNTALLWWRGTYTKAQVYNASVVGTITTTP